MQSLNNSHSSPIVSMGKNHAYVIHGWRGCQIIWQMAKMPTMTNDLLGLGARIAIGWEPEVLK